LESRSEVGFRVRTLGAREVAEDTVAGTDDYVSVRPGAVTQLDRENFQLADTGIDFCGACICARAVARPRGFELESEAGGCCGQRRFRYLPTFRGRKSL
jgi:hypothetical protein